MLPKLVLALSLSLSHPSPPSPALLEARTPARLSSCIQCSRALSRGVAVLRTAIRHQGFLGDTKTLPLGDTVVALSPSCLPHFHKNYYRYSKLTSFHINSHSDYSRSWQTGRSHFTFSRAAAWHTLPALPFPKTVEEWLWINLQICNETVKGTVAEHVSTYSIPTTPVGTEDTQKVWSLLCKMPTILQIFTFQSNWKHMGEL